MGPYSYWLLRVWWAYAPKAGVHHLFIDLNSAYESIYLEKPFGAIMEFGIPPKLIILGKTTTIIFQRSVWIQSILLEPISITCGVRQGDAFARLLCNISLENVIQDLGIPTGGNIFFKTEHSFNDTYSSWAQRSFLKSGEICKKYGAGNKSREDGLCTVIPRLTSDPANEFFG